METFDCQCCELECENRLRPVAWENYTAPTRCQMCNEHQGKPLQRAEDHAREYRRRMDVAIRGARAADRKAEDCEEEAERAFNSRERALRVLDRIASHHHRDNRHDRCSCGRSNCPTLQALSDPWVADRLAALDARDNREDRVYFHRETGGRRVF